MITTQQTITIEDKEYRMIPLDTFLTLQALARQVAGRVKMVNSHVVMAFVEDEHVALAQKALKGLQGR